MEKLIISYLNDQIKEIDESDENLLLASTINSILLKIITEGNKTFCICILLELCLRFHTTSKKKCFQLACKCLIKLYKSHMTKENLANLDLTSILGKIVELAIKLEAINPNFSNGGAEEENFFLKFFHNFIKDLVDIHNERIYEIYKYAIDLHKLKDTFLI